MPVAALPRCHSPGMRMERVSPTCACRCRAVCRSPVRNSTRSSITMPSARQPAPTPLSSASHPRRLPNYKLMAHGGHAAAFIYYGDGNFESVYLRSGRTWRKVLGIDERVRTVDSETGGATWEGDRLLVLSYRHAPLGRLLALDSDGHTRVVLPQQNWAMNGVAAIKGG